MVSNFYIGTRIDRAIRKNKRTVVDVAEQIGMPWGDLFQILIGARQIHLLTLYQLAKACEVNVGYFFKGIDDFSSDPLQRIVEISEKLNIKQKVDGEKARE